MTGTDVDLAGPGKVRPVAARWVVTGDLVLTSAAHVGGRDEGPADLNVLRDRMSGKPLLTGSSLAGALRSHLADLLRGYRSPEHADVSSLFGGDRGREPEQEPGDQSPLIVFDSLAELRDGRILELREGVSIDPARGTARERALFDLEVLPKGTRFPLRFELLVPAQLHEGQLISLLIAALSGLTPGNIALGARRSRGFGGLRSERWKVHRYDLSSPHVWLEWLTSDPLAPLAAAAKAHQEIQAACVESWSGLQLTEIASDRRRVIARVTLSFSGGLLIRSAPTSSDAPDAVHLTSAGEPILPGTSLTGALRTRARRILKVVREQQGDDQQWLERLFGSESGDRHKALLASRLRASEGVIHNAKPLRQTRVQIDRFTQGTTPTALFEEEPVFGGEVEARIELRAPERGEVGLLLLLLKDLLTGDLAIGGTSSVGRGTMRGVAELTLEDGRAFHLDPDLSLDPELERMIHQLHEAGEPT